MSTFVAVVPFVAALAGLVLGAVLIHMVRAVLAQWWYLGSRAAPVLPPAVAGLHVVGAPLPWWLATAGWMALAFMVYRRWGRTSSTVIRWGNKTRRKAGVASLLDVGRAGSTVAMRRQATTVRPSFRLLTWWERLFVGTAECAVLLCRAGLLRVWSSIEDVVMVFGAPRSGKTGWLAARVIDAPGAVLVTSTRPDLYEVTAALRRRRGPVYVFNAVGLGGAKMRSTLTFDPTTGCADPVFARERATDLLSVSSGGGEDRAFWQEQAVRVLTALLHAAALGRRGMVDVQAWVADPDHHGPEVMKLLDKSTQVAFSTDVQQFVGTNQKTRTSITSTIMPALGWLMNPAAVAAATPSSQSLDVEDLLQSRGTIYLLGAPDTPSAPLIAALTGYIAREARRLAAAKPGGRLDPPLLLALDEAALVAPPLDDWTADMGGRGVTIIAAFQSRAQMLDRWGQHGTAKILNNTGSVMVFGGTKDKADLDFWSHLAGDRDEVVATFDERGAVKTRSVRKTPTIAPAQMANLVKARVIVFRRGMPPVVGKARMAWRRRDVREAARNPVSGPTALTVVPPLTHEGDTDARAS